MFIYYYIFLSDIDEEEDYESNILLSIQPLLVNERQGNSKP